MTSASTSSRLLVSLARWLRVTRQRLWLMNDIDLQICTSINGNLNLRGVEYVSAPCLTAVKGDVVLESPRTKRMGRYHAVRFFTKCVLLPGFRNVATTSRVAPDPAASHYFHAHPLLDSGLTWQHPRPSVFLVPTALILETINECPELKPDVVGFGVTLNEIIKRLSSKRGKATNPIEPQ